MNPRVFAVSLLLYGSGLCALVYQTVWLRERLLAPRGIARVWWAVRTTYLAPAELERRLAALRASL